MGWFRPSRDPYGPDPYLHWKIVCFAAGAGFGVAAMVTGIDWLVLPAILVLGVGIALRFLRPKS